MLITVSRAVCWRSTQIVGGEPGVGKAVIGELHRAGGGAADAIEARLRLVEAAERRRFSSAAGSPPAGAKFVRHHAHKLPLVEAGFTLNLQFARRAASAPAGGFQHAPAGWQ